MATKVINALTFGDTYVLTTPYATCSTAAGTAAKVATITPGSAFSLETGVRVSVKFTNALSVAAPTLNVNSSGAKAIYFRGATLSSAQYWAAGSTVDFVYDGNYWQMLGSQHNSTYSLSSFGVTASATELNYTDGVTSNIQTQLNSKLPVSGGNVTGHIYLTGASANSSTANTSQLVFGTSSNNHVAISSNNNAIVINPTTSSTTNQIVLYLDSPSVFPSGIQANVTGNASTATNVAWSGVTSKPSYYDAKAITSISRSGTTFTATYLDGTTATFSQQDNNTNTAHSHTAGTGLTASGSGGTSGTTTYSANLNSTTSLGTIGTTSKLYAVGVDSAGKLCVDVPWIDTNTYGRSGDTSSKIYLIGTTTQSTGNKTTYSHDTAYVGTDGCLYSGGTKVLTAHQSVSNSAPTLAWGTTSTVGTIGGTALTVTMPANPNSDTKVTQNAVITTAGSYPVILGNSTATTAVTGAVNKSNKLLFNPGTGNLSIGTSGTDGSGSITLEGSLTMGSSQTDAQGIMPRASNWNSLGMYNKYWYRAYVSTVYCGSIKTLAGGTFSFPATITWNTF